MIFNIKNLVLFILLLFVYYNNLDAQVNVQENYKSKYHSHHYCSLSNSLFFKSSINEKIIKIEKYKKSDERIKTKKGRLDIIEEAFENIFQYGKYLEKCGNSVGLNYFINHEISPQKYPSISGGIDVFRNKSGGDGRVQLKISFGYDQIQRKHNVAATNKIEHSTIRYPENGYVLMVGGWFILPHQADGIFIPATQPDLKEWQESYGKGVYVTKGSTEFDYSSSITIYPLVFDSEGFYLEGEKTWAVDIVEAVEYLILHELGHLEAEFSYSLNWNLYPKLGNKEENADDFAFSVWRCKDQ